MPVAAVADPFDRAAGSAGVLMQAVFDGVPGERRSDLFLSGLVDFACSQRPLSRRKHADHCFLNSAGSPSELALRLDGRRWFGRKRPGQQVRARKTVAVQTCPVFFHSIGLEPAVGLRDQTLNGWRRDVPIDVKCR